MKPIAADLPHLDRHLPVARFNAAGLGNDDPLKAHVPAGQHGVPVTGQRQRWEQKINRPDFIFASLSPHSYSDNGPSWPDALPCLMKKLLVLHFKGGVRVSGTGSGCGSRVVASLERDDVGAIVQGGLRAESRAIQRQRGTGTVKDLYADVSRAARGRVLQGQYRWVGAVNRRAGKRNGGFLETVVSQSFSWILKPTAVLVLPAVASFAERTWPN
jgi:hypothetical protein